MSAMYPMPATGPLGRAVAHTRRRAVATGENAAVRPLPAPTCTEPPTRQTLVAHMEALIDYGVGARDWTDELDIHLHAWLLPLAYGPDGAPEPQGEQLAVRARDAAAVAVRVAQRAGSQSLGPLVDLQAALDRVLSDEDRDAEDEVDDDDLFWAAVCCRRAMQGLVLPMVDQPA